MKSSSTALLAMLLCVFAVGCSAAQQAAWTSGGVDLAGCLAQCGIAYGGGAIQEWQTPSGQTELLDTTAIGCVAACATRFGMDAIVIAGGTMGKDGEAPLRVELRGRNP